MDVLRRPITTQHTRQKHSHRLFHIVSHATTTNYTGATNSECAATSPFLLHQWKQQPRLSSIITAQNGSIVSVEDNLQVDTIFEQTQPSELEQEEMTEFEYVLALLQ